MISSSLLSTFLDMFFMVFPIFLVVLCVEGFCNWGTEINCGVDNIWWPTWPEFLWVRFFGAHAFYWYNFCFAGSLLCPSLWQILHGKASHGWIYTCSETYQECERSTSVASNSEHYGPEPKKWTCYMLVENQIEFWLSLVLSEVYKCCRLTNFFCWFLADYIFSNEYINYLITYPFDFRNEELLSYYISFLRFVLTFKLFYLLNWWLVVDDCTHTICFLVAVYICFCSLLISFL